MPIPEITTRARAAAYPLAYNPAFDGLRAVAVIVVMLLHARVPGFGSGEFGVDVFFVLSGYLITSLLIRGMAQRQPLGMFYWHRFVRLTPPLIVVCASLLAVAPLLACHCRPSMIALPRYSTCRTGHLRITSKAFRVSSPTPGRWQSKNNSI